MTADDANRSVPPGPSAPPGRGDDEPTIPSTSRDDSDEGWGDEGGGRDADWYRRERPPHHE